jgi:excisionase family DNA binding protein
VDTRSPLELPPFLTVPEFARLARISRACAYELAATGRIPSRRFGRRIVIPSAALGGTDPQLTADRWDTRTTKRGRRP